MKVDRIQTCYSPIFKIIKVALLAGVVGASGCLSTTRRIERHLKVHPERPDSIIQALRDGRIVMGMSQEEVRLVMGPPARTEQEGEDSTAVWHYDNEQQGDKALRSSTMWTLPIPSKTVIFDASGVQEIIDYDEQESVEQPAASLTTAEDTRDISLQTTTPLPATTMIPVYRPNPDELNVYGWPAITLQGLTGSGVMRNAILNGSLLESGESIGSVRLDAIYSNGVVLEYRDQRAFLRPGESTGSPQEKGQP